jgi:hypothetical protein
MRRCDKNSLILETTKILHDFLLPLMRFALSIGRVAAGMGPEADSLGGSQWESGSFYKEGSRKDGTHLDRRLLPVGYSLS